MLDHSRTLEVSRLCTDGTANACSFLYGAVRRAAFAMGYARVITYTLPEEGGASLRAAGWCMEHTSPGGKWARSGRPSNDHTRPLGPKHRYAVDNPQAIPLDIEIDFATTKTDAPLLDVLDAAISN